MMWNLYLRLIFGPVCHSIKPPVGLSPFVEHSSVSRATYIMKLAWWRVHNRLDQRLGADRRARWARSHSG